MKNLRSIFIKTFIVQIILMLCISVSYAQNNYQEGKLYRHTLDNGLEVLTIERHLAPLIYHQLTYKVGSRNERLGITGISHVVEHMMFKGTEKFGKGKASKMISENSGIFNAFTSNDMTSYFEYLPLDKIELAMEIESDRMMNCIFNPEEFDSEIEVIKQERRMRSESSPNGIFHETMNSVAYVSHPNRDPIIGWPCDLDKITREDAFTYYKTYYTPNNAFLVLVGDFNTDEILAKVKKYYNNIPKGPDVKDINVVEQPQKVRKTFSVFHNDIADPSVRIAFHVPNYKDPDAPALKLAGMILCERNRDARLYKSLVEKNQIATSAAGGFGMSKDPGLFSISANLRPDSSVDKVEQLIWEEISLMQNELVTDKEFQKVKNRYKFNEITSFIKNRDIGSRVSNYEAYFGYEMMDSFYNKVLNVTKEGIRDVMKKYFNPDQVTIGYMYPKEKGKIKGKKSVSPDELSGEENQEETNTDEPKPENYFYFKSPEEIFKDLNSLASGDVIKPSPIEPMIKTFTLDNGVKLHTIESHLVPDIAIVGSIETGNILEANEGKQPGIGTVLADVMNRGTENYTYQDLSERMAFVPFQFYVGGSWRSFSFQGYSLVDDVDEMMKTGLDMLTKPAFRDEDIKKVKARHQISARNMLKKTGMKAFYYMYNNLFADHPYSKVRSTEESIKSIQKEDLIALYKKYFNPSKLTLLMLGDMSHEKMRELANKYFGDWKGVTKSDEIPIPPINELKKKEIKVFTEKDYAECTINIGFAPFNNIDPEEKEIVNVLNYILSESALTSRMGVELRDKQGLIYGIKSELWAPNDNIGYWKFNTKTGPKNVEKVITGIFGEIKKLIADGITDDELEAAKNRKLGLLPFYIETPGDVASIVYNMIIDNIPFNDFDKKEERIKAVTKDDVLRIAKKYFTLDRYIIVVDGPIEENSLDYLVDKLK